jgi:ATP-dependent Lon protease
MDDETIRHIIWNYTNEAGIRKLREILYDTFREINLQSIRGDDCNNLKLKLSIDFIEDHILRHRSRPHRTRADTERVSNRIYGLFATSSGVGGVLPIRISKDITCKEPSLYPVTVTGRLGDTMKESVNVARMVALQQLSVSDDWGTISGHGIHIHFPEGATPKDGPSAGAAITTLLWAYYSGRSIPGDLAMTGEIDLNGRVLAIGGLQEKLIGAKADGIRTVFIPTENERDLRIIRERIPAEDLPEKVLLIGDIHDVIREISALE